MKVNAWTGISTIARLAFRECARSRVLHALVASMALALGVAYIFGWVAGGDSAAHRSSKVVLDLSLSAISVLGSMAAIFLGTGLVYQEVERRTVYGLLARPVSRSGFLIGKYLGLIAVLGIAMIFMSLILLGGFLLIGGEVTGALLAALALTYVELCVITAVALLFAVLAHPIEGAVFTFVQGTDPEVLLLFEAYEESGQQKWRYAIARMSMVPTQVHHGASLAWETEWAVRRTYTPYYVYKSF